MKLLFVTSLDASRRQVYGLKWRATMRLLFVSKLDRFSRAAAPMAKYVEAGKALGHDVAIFGEQSAEFPSIPHSLDVTRFDYVVFVVYETKDFPDLPYLARLLDGVPRSRRVVIDCCGRYNDTIRVEHDFNHLEKLDGHQGWEWVEGIQAISSTILQPTFIPRRSDVRPFLFHGYDPHAVARTHGSAPEAATAWARNNGSARPYGIVYIGHNWQRWSQLQRFLEAVEPIRDRVGRICLIGWRWDERPDWAAELGVAGVDVDTALLKRLDVETRWSVTFDEFIATLGGARFAPVFHRPLFNELGLVTTRTFETFCADTIPVLMLPASLVESVYGPAALELAPDGDVPGKLQDMLRRPEHYWDVVLKTRAHLAEHHSYQRRLTELLSILES